MVHVRSCPRARLGHEKCDRVSDQFPLINCPRYLLGRPLILTLYDKKSIEHWVMWWRANDYLGMNIVKHKTAIEGVEVVVGNPFDSGCLVSIRGGLTVPAKVCLAFWDV